MKKLFLLLLFIVPIFINSCSNNELKKGEAKEIITQYYHLPFQTKIVIDKRFDDYGWPPERYRKLEDSGFISLTELKSFLTRGFLISLNESARDYWLQNGTLYQEPEGNRSIIIFKGYRVSVKNVSVSSNAKENRAEAEVTLEISDVSPIQQIFSPLESLEIKKTINFKLFDDRWKIVEDDNSKKLFNPISAPQHWAGNWQLTFNDTPADIGITSNPNQVNNQITENLSDKLLGLWKFNKDEILKISKNSSGRILFHRGYNFSNNDEKSISWETDESVNTNYVNNKLMGKYRIYEGSSPDAYSDIKFNIELKSENKILFKVHTQTGGGGIYNDSYEATKIY